MVLQDKCECFDKFITSYSLVYLERETDPIRFRVLMSSLIKILKSLVYLTFAMCKVIEGIITNVYSIEYKENTNNSSSVI